MCSDIMYIVFIHIVFLVIDQVTGVTLTCEPVRLANQCTVMWNVSLYISACIHLRFSVMSN